MKRCLRFISIITCLSFLLCACTNDQTDSDVDPNGSTTDNIETSEQSKLNVITPTVYSSVSSIDLEPGSTISIIGRYSDDSFWSQVEAGANYAIAELNAALGYTGSDKIKLTYSAPSVRDDVNEQINILDEELSRYPVAIGIAAIDTSACSLQFDLATENNIPIVTFDSGSDYQHVAAHIATDNLEAASTAASKLAYEIGEAGEIAIIVQDSTSMTALNRLEGFTDTIATDFPGISVVHTYHLDNEDPTAEVQSLSPEETVKMILENNPNLKGIYATNLDTTQLVANVLVELERTDLALVGFDGGEEQLTLLESGVIDGLVLQNPFGMGYATVIAAARVNGELGNESFINTGYVWVTKDNMTDTTIANMLY